MLKSLQKLVNKERRQTIYLDTWSKTRERLLKVLKLCENLQQWQQVTALAACYHLHKPALLMQTV